MMVRSSYLGSMVCLAWAYPLPLETVLERLAAAVVRDGGWEPVDGATPLDRGWRRSGRSGTTLRLVPCGLLPRVAVLAPQDSVRSLGAGREVAAAVRRVADEAPAAGARIVAPLLVPEVIRRSNDSWQQWCVMGRQLSQMQLDLTYQSCAECGTKCALTSRWCANCEAEFVGAANHADDSRRHALERYRAGLAAARERLVAAQFAFGPA